MAQVINLRLARKAKARRDAALAASENRVRHGRTRHERVAQSAEAERAARDLAGHKLDDAD